MNDEEHLDSIEGQLNELSDATRAGVFARTPVSQRDFVTSLHRAPGGAGVWTLRSKLAVAAVMLLAAGVWSWIFTIELDAVRRHAQSGSRTAVLAAATCRDQDILKCVGGPTRLAVNDCDAHDYDTDGDVDLADFSAFQSRCRGATP